MGTGEVIFLRHYEALNCAPALFLADDGHWVATLSAEAVVALLDAWVDAQGEATWAAKPHPRDLADRWYWGAVALKRTGSVPSAGEATEHLVDMLLAAGSISALDGGPRGPVCRLLARDPT